MRASTVFIVSVVSLMIVSCISQPSYFSFLDQAGVAPPETEESYALLTVSRNRREPNGTMTPMGLATTRHIVIRPGDSINYAGTVKAHKTIISVKITISGEAVWDWTGAVTEDNEIPMLSGSTWVPETPVIHNLSLRVGLADGSEMLTQAYVTVDPCAK